MNGLRKAEVWVKGVVFQLEHKGTVDADTPLGYLAVTSISVLGYSFDCTNRGTYRLMGILVARGRLAFEVNDSERDHYVLTIEDGYVKVAKLQGWHNDDVETTYDTLGEALEALADKGVITNLKRPTEAVEEEL